MRQNVELRLVKYNYIHTCFEENNAREAIKDKLWGNGHAVCGKNVRVVKNTIFQRVGWCVLWGMGEPSYLTPGTNQGI